MKPQRLDSLTSLRFFAALMVAVFHSCVPWARSGPTGVVGNLGWLGVTFFFVLSGFVIAWTYRAGQSRRKFIARRLARIYPLHLAMLVFVLGGFAATGHVAGGYRGTPLGTLADALLLQAWDPLNPHVNLAWDGVAWSLSCEFFFYLAAPLLFEWMARRTFGTPLLLTWLVLLGLAAWTYELRSAQASIVLVALPLPRMFEFALGAAAALYLRDGAARTGPWLGTLACATVLCVAWFTLGPYPPGIASPLLIEWFAPACALLIYLVAQSDVRGGSRWLRGRGLVFLGEASFALYMTHAVLLGIVVHFLRPVFPSSQTSVLVGEGVRLLYLCAAVALAAAVHRGFEAPVREVLLRWLDASDMRPHRAAPALARGTRPEAIDAPVDAGRGVNDRA